MTMRALTFCLALLCFPPLKAEIVSYRFEGVVDGIAQFSCVTSGDDSCAEVVEQRLQESTNYPAHTFRIGDPFSLSATWLLDAGSPILFEPESATYLDAVVSASLSTAGFSLPSPAFSPEIGGFSQQVRVTDNVGPSADVFVLVQSFSPNEAVDDRLLAPIASVGLVDSSGTAFNSFRIPMSIDLRKFDLATAALSFVGALDVGFGTTLLVTASLDKATVVPIPAGAWLLSSALGLLGCVRSNPQVGHPQSPIQSSR